MKQRNRLLSLFIAALLLVAPALAVAESAEKEPVNAIEVLKEATSLDLSEYAGKAIYLNFFTEWCPYCMKELPDIKKLAQAYNPEELQVVLVHVWDGEDETNTQSIKETYGLQDMTFFEDKDRLLSYVVGLQGYPLSVFLAKDGTVHSGVSGIMEYESMEATMAELGVTKLDAKDEMK